MAESASKSGVSAGTDHDGSLRGDSEGCQAGIISGMDRAAAAACHRWCRAAALLSLTVIKT